MPREYFNDFPVCATIRELILDGFDRGGEKRQFLFRDEDGVEREKRFCDVAADTAALGAFLRSRGYGAGAKIAILSENCYFWNVVFYAVQCNGSVAVPLEPALPADELAAQMANESTLSTIYSTLHSSTSRAVANKAARESARQARASGRGGRSSWGGGGGGFSGGGFGGGVR
jgi:long-subunit acyl-CoA synthetase (AMP-forming)